MSMILTNKVINKNNNYNCYGGPQCDQMARLLFNILPFSIMTVCQIAFKIGQSKHNILPNTICFLIKWPKFFNVVLKWRNFTTSGHTVGGDAHSKGCGCESQNRILDLHYVVVKIVRLVWNRLKNKEKRLGIVHCKSYSNHKNVKVSTWWKTPKQEQHKSKFLALYFT